MEIKRSALVLHSATDMYRLVLDVPSYPLFLNWCTGSRVVNQTTEAQVATLEIRVGGLSHEFTTMNRLVPAEAIFLSLREGPFSRLSGQWEFLQLGTQGSKVTLQLAFDFSSSILSAAFRRGFTRIADRLVEDFSRRADAVYSR